MENTWTLRFKNFSYLNLPYTLSLSFFFSSIVPVSVTLAICLWLKKRWIDCWKVMIYDWGQISEVNEHQLCSSLRLVSLHNSTVFKLLLESPVSQLGLQFRKLKGTLLIGLSGATVYEKCKIEAKRVKTTQSTDTMGEHMSDWRDGTHQLIYLNPKITTAKKKKTWRTTPRARHLEFNTVKCPFLFISMFQFKCSLRRQCVHGRVI